MHRKTLFILVVAFSLVFGLASAGMAKTITLTFANQNPDTSWSGMNAIGPWAKQVEEATGGKVKVQVFYSQTLCKGKDTWEATKNGIADIGFEGCKAKDADGNSCFGVHIFVGGKASFEAKEARQVFKAIPLTEAKHIVKKIATLYKNERLEGESFEMYESRTCAGLSIEELQAKIMNI